MVKTQWREGAAKKVNDEHEDEVKEKVQENIRASPDANH
jgi:hypothetical protein